MGFLGFWWRQIASHPKPVPTSLRLAGKTAIVTGANVGIGREVARQLAEHRCSRVILAVRDAKRGEEAKADMAGKIKHECEIEVWQVDYQDFASLQSFARRASELPRLDYVALNAGLMQNQFVKSTTGHELQLQVNFFATALLSLLLLPTLRESAAKTGSASRLTFTTSEVYEWTEFKQRSAPNIFAELDDPTKFSKGDMDNYGVTKLLVVLWVRELASRVPASETVINCVNPGLCWSSLHRDMDSAGFRFFKRTCAWTASEGAHCVADALVSHPDSHGEYLSLQKIQHPSQFVASPEGQTYRTKLWEQTLEQAKQDAPSLADDIQVPQLQQK